MFGDGVRAKWLKRAHSLCSRWTQCDDLTGHELVMMEENALSDNVPTSNDVDGDHKAASYSYLAANDAAASRLRFEGDRGRSTAQCDEHRKSVL